MTDTELSAWWPDLGAVVAALRRMDRGDVADRLLEAVCGGATSGEVLGRVGLVLDEHRALRPRVGDSAAGSWKAVMADVGRAFPGFGFRRWIGRLMGR